MNKIFINAVGNATATMGMLAEPGHVVTVRAARGYYESSLTERPIG